MAIVQQSPVNFATDVIKNPFIWIQYDVALDRLSVNEYTVILVETDNPENIISGSVDYIVATKKITFQLYEFLKASTEYTMIVVGGTSGIYKAAPNREVYSSSNYVFHFTTGASTDWALPLANRTTYTDGPYFTGNGGVYTEVFGRTGEPISHIVTTAAQVSPSGHIVPAPFGAERYLPPASGVYDETTFELVSTDPSNSETDVVDTSISFTFNSSLTSVSAVTIKVYDILGDLQATESTITNYDMEINGTDFKIFTITPNGTNTIRTSSNYIITLTNVEDIIGRIIPTVTLGFQTHVEPLYATVTSIRLSLGQLIASVSADEIIQMIYENSIWAYDNSIAIDKVLNEPSQEAIDYVNCKTKLDLLERQFIKGGAVESKQLANLRITYGPALEFVIKSKIEKLENCVNRNKALILGIAFIPVVSAVKASSDPRKPSWKRLVDTSFTEDTI